MVAEKDGAVCTRIQCRADDLPCRRNKTMTISWQYLPVPNLDFITAPLTILNIRTTGYSIFPNLQLNIIQGNERDFFDTIVRGDKAVLRLLRPLSGPTEKSVTLELLNRNFAGNIVTSRHVTHVTLLVEKPSFYP
ncbi:fibulin-1 [Plakobranchus ocellatus]|uniref:Fibulin-1 n=1 Tax=Plakobranchus ocellatus TaxID=259542 RepID=A0AAV3Z0J5_9GAST|nr:fibulin-1 [Plakobranchus ocellatus]